MTYYLDSMSKYEFDAATKHSPESFLPYQDMVRIVKAADGRPLTGPQQADFDRANKAFHAAATLKARDRVHGLKAINEAGADPEAAIKAAEGFMSGTDRMTMPSNEPVRSHGPARGDAAEVKALKSGDKLADRYGPSEYGLTDYVKAVVTGDWGRLPDATKAMSLSDALGGHLVPDPLSARVIDRARNASRVQQAGAVLIPMESSSLRIARLASDPTPAWKIENALIAASDPAFEAVELKAKTLAARLVMSVELAEDAPTVNDTIEAALAGSLAVEMDRAAMYGSGTPPQPLGLKNTPGIQVLSAGANGAAPGYAAFSTAVQMLDAANATAPYGAIYSPRTAGSLDRLVDSTGSPSTRPTPSVAWRSTSPRRCPTPSRRAPRPPPATPSWATGRSSPSACGPRSASRPRSWVLMRTVSASPPCRSWCVPGCAATSRYSSLPTSWSSRD